MSPKGVYVQIPGKESRKKLPSFILSNLEHKLATVKFRIVAVLILVLLITGKYLIKFIVCAFGNLYHQISSEKFELKPGLVQRQARDLEVRGSNASSGSNFFLEI